MGSKDSNISVWIVPKDLTDVSNFQIPKFVIYSHHNEIITMNTQKDMNLLFSSDNVILSNP